MQAVRAVGLRTCVDGERPLVQGCESPMISCIWADEEEGVREQAGFSAQTAAEMRFPKTRVKAEVSVYKLSSKRNINAAVCVRAVQSIFSGTTDNHTSSWKATSNEAAPAIPRQ